MARHRPGYAPVMRTEQLREIIQDRGPFVSVYVDASHDTEDAVTQNELRWRATETQLSESGADDATIAAAKRAVLGSPAVGKAGRAVIAAHGDVLCVADLPVPPANAEVRVSPVPYLLPLLASAEPSVPHVVVLADKTGGRLLAVDADGGTISDTAQGSVEDRSEETVRRTAREIAEAATRLVERVDAELLVVAGTIAARAAIQAALPQHVHELVAELDVNAAHTDLDAAEVSTGVRRLLAQRVAEQDEAALERFHVASAHGNACEGLSRVTEALRVGAVETILVTDLSLADRTVWLGTDPSQVATGASELQEAVERRADEAVPAAALATAANVLVLSGAATVKDGVAALLRF